MKVLKTSQIIENRDMTKDKNGNYYYPVSDDFKIIGKVVFSGSEDECYKFCLDQE